MPGLYNEKWGKQEKPGKMITRHAGFDQIARKIGAVTPEMLKEIEAESKLAHDTQLELNI